jgi:hypothetical protein
MIRKVLQLWSGWMQCNRNYTEWVLPTLIVTISDGYESKHDTHVAYGHMSIEFLSI